VRILWTLIKVAVGLAIAIPLGLLLLAATVGIVGTMVGLAVAAVRLAFVGCVLYAAFRIFRFFAVPRRTPRAEPAPQLPRPDPYYTAAMRELDAEIRQS
jgi:hypothetical protein